MNLIEKALGDKLKSNTTAPNDKKNYVILS